jgi:hypothetical protein
MKVSNLVGFGLFVVLVSGLIQKVEAAVLVFRIYPEQKVDVDLVYLDNGILKIDANSLSARKKAIELGINLGPQPDCSQKFDATWSQSSYGFPYQELALSFEKPTVFTSLFSLEANGQGEKINPFYNSDYLPLFIGGINKQIEGSIPPFKLSSLVYTLKDYVLDMPENLSVGSSKFCLPTTPTVVVTPTTEPTPTPEPEKVPESSSFLATLLALAIIGLIKLRR